ncbi:hypothetical protein E2C01_045354 [Portunus trituberculatus]|uniref:Uncharacterized protein n=1 Tax=Portunus trituberculatus TaxID=210409 RepID=A0A5B7G1T3_PORTR|nr:hypothetical protein [Portunus trituberculatus]
MDVVDTTRGVHMSLYLIGERYILRGVLYGSRHAPISSWREIVEDWGRERGSREDNRGSKRATLGCIAELRVA